MSWGLNAGRARRFTLPGRGLAAGSRASRRGERNAADKGKGQKAAGARHASGESPASSTLMLSRAPVTHVYPETVDLAAFNSLAQSHRWHCRVRSGPPKWVAARGGFPLTAARPE